MESRDTAIRRDWARGIALLALPPLITWMLMAVTYEAPYKWRSFEVFDTASTFLWLVTGPIAFRSLRRTRPRGIVKRLLEMVLGAIIGAATYFPLFMVMARWLR